MWSLNDRKKIIIIFAVALLIRLIALACFQNEQSLIFTDSKHYMQVAQNLIQKGIYPIDTGPNPQPDSFRTPILPLFLIPFLYFHISLYWIALAEDIIMAFAAVALYLLGRKLFNEKAAFIAAILSGLEPYSALISNQILTEAPFTLIFTLSLLLLALYIKEQKPKYLYLGSLLLAVASLTKPIAFPLLILIPLATILEKFTKKFDEANGIFKKQKMPWKKLAISLLILIAVISPWLAFNRLVLKIWSFSTLTNFNLYQYNADAFNKWLIGKGEIAAGGADALRYIKQEDFWSPERTSAYFNTAKDFIMKRPLEYAGFVLLRSYRLFLYSGYDNIVNGLKGGFTYHNISDFKNDVLKLKLASAVQKFKERPDMTILLVGEAFFALIAVMAFLNLFLHHYAKTEKPFHYLFFCTLIFFAILVTPVGNARLRIPINPILFLLALDSLIILIGAYRKRDGSPLSGQI